MTIIDHKELQSIRQKHAGEKIVYCSGSFDLTHAGHILFFEDCKKRGDVLVVAVGHDNAIKNLKGKIRPILNEHIRLKTVASLKPVDYCFLDIVANGHPLSFVNDHVFQHLQPDVYVINTDAFDIPYREEASKKYNVELVILKRWCPSEYQDISTTNIISKIRGNFSK